MSEYYSYEEPHRVADSEIVRDAREDKWTTGDGSRIPVSEMTDQHLYFALAKSHRNEYPDARSKASGRAVLEKEVRRRLYPITVAAIDGAYQDLRVAHDTAARLSEELKGARAKNAKLNEIAMKYRQTRAGLGLPPVEIE